MNEFYQFTAQDFERASFSQVQVGDNIAWGEGHGQSYGAVPIEDITRILGGYAIDMILPLGVNTCSTDRRDIRIEWEGEKPIIRITCYYFDNQGQTDYLLIQRQK